MTLDRHPVIIPIAGGKGGVGKSFITASLGAHLASLGWRVVMIDLDLGAANLHTLMGIRPPVQGVPQFLNRSAAGLDETAIATGTDNLSLISAAHANIEIPNLYHQQKLKIIRGMGRLDYDIVLVDLGGGTHFNTLDFYLTAPSGLLVFTPEPTAVENAIRFIKAVYLRRLKQVIKQNTFTAIVNDSVDQAQQGKLNTPDIIDLILRHDPDKEPRLREELAQFTFQLVMNKFRKNHDIRLGENLAIVCNRHFYSRFAFLGAVSYDEHVHDSVCAKQLYLQKYPYAPAAGDLRRLADRITAAINPIQRQTTHETH